MDLVTVNKKTYAIQTLVDGWRSLVWAERYQPWGDFELHTEDVDATRALLPERSLCSLRDSREVMMVDSHDIAINSDGVPELVVKGRTVDSFLENRVWKNAPYGKSAKMADSYTLKQAAAVWVWNAIANGSGDDRIKTSQPYPAGNKITGAVVTVTFPAGSDTSTSKKRRVENGVVYDQLMTFLTSGKMGIRIMRPVPGNNGRRVTVNSDGTYTVSSVENILGLRFDIYKGRDLTSKIVFSWRAGHLLEPKYLMSSAAFKTGAYVVGDPREIYYTDPDAIAGANSGWNRRDTYVDGGSKEDGETGDEFEEGLEDLGSRAVRKEGAHINTVDAKISPFIDAKYGVDYRLGDRVKVQGQYGTQNKYVTEFIRTHDENGEVGYPTLSSKLS